MRKFAVSHCIQQAMNEKSEVSVESFREYKEAFLERHGHSVLSTHGQVNKSFDYVWQKADEIPLDEALVILKESAALHEGDPNLPAETFVRLDQLLNKTAPYDKDDELYSIDARSEAAMFKFFSPYPEVRAVTDPFDDPTIPVETFRAYLVGLIWCIIGAGVNTFFEPRMPNISVGSDLLCVFAAASGKGLAFILPDWGFVLWGTRYTLNPGPYSFKEQMLVSIIIGSASGSAYSLYNIMSQKLDIFYGQKWAGAGYQILLTLGSQFMGFGLAGILRRLVVYPVRAIWPTLLPTLALNRAILATDVNEAVHGWRLSRFKFFSIFFAASFLYYWIPGYLFPALSTFDWLIWIKPENFNLNIVTGFYGLGINPVSTFDWNYISFNSPLILPLYTQINNYVGILLAGAVVIPIVYWKNYRWTAYLPLNSNQIFTNQGELYDVTAVLTDGLLDHKKYQEYSPPFYSAANLVVYGAFFALYPYSFVETLLTSWKTIGNALAGFYRGLRTKRSSNYDGHSDAFSRMMAKYKEVPDWWFLVILVISMVLGILCVELYPTQTPVWSLFFALGINFVFLIPITLITSATGFSYALNVIVELIIGYALPGNGTALMIVKAFGTQIDSQSENYISDQKLAHYTKVPPRAIFRGQIIGGFFQSFITIGIANWLISNVDGLCTSKQRTMSKFTCPNENTFFSASVLWGVIGPKIVFHGLYPILKWCFLIGALLPFPIWLLKRKFYRQLRDFQPVVVIGGMLTYAPYSLAFYTPSLYTSLLFMLYIRRRYFAWWDKYNYVLTSALSSGLALSAIIIFFAVQYHPKDLNWWGTVGYAENLDFEGIPPLLPLPEAGFFGAAPGHYPEN